MSVNRCKKVAFAGLFNEKNYGDPILAYCTEWIFRQNFNIETLHLDLNKNDFNKEINATLKEKIYRKLGAHFNYFADLCNKLHANRLNKISQIYYNEYKSKLNDTEFIVLVGGGLIKYKVQFFYSGLKGLLDCASDFNIPVFASGIGVEGFDSKNWKCLLLKQILHHPALKFISIRDDYELLVNKYYDNHPHITCLKVCDPAVWASEAYNITSNTESKTIGIGIIRDTIFSAYGNFVTSKEVRNFYLNLVINLLKRGESVHLFTNGINADNIVAEAVRKELKDRGYNIILDIPQSPAELVKIIANFKGIIGARMHACIIAYSLNIPAIGLIWNKKIQFWSKNIGIEKYYIFPSNFSPDLALSNFYELMDSGYNGIIRSSFRHSIIDSIKGLCVNM